MESEKVKEIKKALKKNIRLGLSYEDKENYCKVWLADILTLINELESENERLVEQRNKTFNIWVKDTKELKDRIAELEKENAKYKQKLTTNQWVQEIRKEALKQFAERLKDSGEIKALLEMETMPKVFKHIHNEIIKRIDETLKEFLCGNNQ